MTMIMHIDMDAFFASIEQQVNPALRGKPVIVGGRNNKYRSIVCAASYEAKRLGIDSAMLSWQAFRICPEAIFVPADTTKYVYTSNEIFGILQTFSPQVEKFAIDEFFLNIDGCEKLWGSPETLGRAVKDKIRRRFGLTCSVGIGPSRLISKLAAKIRKPDGLVVLNGPQEARRVIQNIPIEKICGIGERLKRRFNLLGVTTCGDLGEFPDELLRGHFGVTGLHLKAIARAEDAGGVGYFADQEEPPKSVGHSQTLREVATDQLYLRNWIYLLSEMVGVRLRHQGLVGRTVHFFISDGFSGGFSKQKTFIEPTDDGFEIYERCLVVIRLLGLNLLRGRVLAISLTNLSKVQNGYLFDRQIKRRRVLKSVDRINDRFGEWTVCPASLKSATFNFNP